MLEAVYGELCTWAHWPILVLVLFTVVVLWFGPSSESERGRVWKATLCPLLGLPLLWSAPGWAFDVRWNIFRVPVTTSPTGWDVARQIAFLLLYGGGLIASLCVSGRLWRHERYRGPISKPFSLSRARVEHDGKSFPLSCEGKPMTIGSGVECDIRVSGDGIGWQHVGIRWSEEQRVFLLVGLPNHTEVHIGRSPSGKTVEVARDGTPLCPDDTIVLSNEVTLTYRETGDWRCKPPRSALPAETIDSSV